MRRIRWCGFVATVVILSCCSSAEIELAYRFPPIQNTIHTWKIDAVVTTNSPTGSSRRNISAVVEVDEIVMGPTEGGRPRLVVSLRPIRIVEDGLSSSPDLTVRIDLEVDNSGRVTRLFRTSNLPAGPLVALDLDRIFLEARPILPPTPVGIGDRWASPQRGRAENSSVDLKGSGKLLGFLVKDRSRLAVIEIDRSGTVSTSQPVGRARASASGNTTIHTRAYVDLDRGVLKSSASTSTSVFELTLGGENRAGEVRIELTSTLDLISVKRLERLPESLGG